MIRTNEIALSPASLATEGNQGESAKALDLCDAEHSSLDLTLSATSAVRRHLDRYSLATDDPAPGVIDAADLIDAAMVALCTELNRERKSPMGDA
jgi:hypothetical protein